MWNHSKIRNECFLHFIELITRHSILEVHSYLQLHHFNITSETIDVKLNSIPWKSGKKLSRFLRDLRSRATTLKWWKVYLWKWGSFKEEEVNLNFKRMMFVFSICSICKLHVCKFAKMNGMNQTLAPKISESTAAILLILSWVRKFKCWNRLNIIFWQSD